LLLFSDVIVIVFRCYCYFYCFQMVSRMSLVFVCFLLGAAVAWQNDASDQVNSLQDIIDRHFVADSRVSFFTSYILRSCVFRSCVFRSCVFRSCVFTSSFLQIGFLRVGLLQVAFIIVGFLQGCFYKICFTSLI
jgi:hypothetical protein